MSNLIKNGTIIFNEETKRRELYINGVNVLKDIDDDCYCIYYNDNLYYYQYEAKNGDIISCLIYNGVNLITEEALDWDDDDKDKGIFRYLVAEKEVVTHETKYDWDGQEYDYKLKEPMYIITNHIWKTIDINKVKL